MSTRKRAAIAAVILATTIVATETLASAYPSILKPSDGAHFGTFVKARSGESPQDAIARVERTIGRTFRVDHRYYKWDSAFPNSYDTWTYAQGRIAFVNWNARKRSGSIVSWSSIANGNHNELIRTRARAIKAFGQPMYLTFHHEPEDDGAFGSKADFIAAFRRIVGIFQAEDVTNVAWAWTLMGSSFIEGTARDWYPGDAYVDFVAADSYNWYPGRRTAEWRSFKEGVAPTVAFARRHRKPVAIAEYGVQEDPDRPGRKAGWFHDTLTALRDWPRIKAVIYFDSPKIYPWITDSSASSIEAYGDIGSSGWLT